MKKLREKVEFGDFQTPLPLAEMVCRHLHGSGIMPATIIEPTCGKGSFLDAAATVFGPSPDYYGFDVNSDYITDARRHLHERHPDRRFCLQTQNFFSFDWEAFLQDKKEPVLFLGNPPWVTNSGLGDLGSDNLPEKSNLKQLSGLNARTGKANFDISEWMLLRLLDAIGNRTYTIAMLCKTGVARKVLEFHWRRNLRPFASALYQIDAMAWFGASVNACVLRIQPGSPEQASKIASLYENLESGAPASCFGLVDSQMVSHVDDFVQLQHLNGVNYYKWRSGVKHDLARIMEFQQNDDALVNGLGEVVDVEETYLYPLLKSTEVAKGITQPSRYVLITQQFVGEDTDCLRHAAPKTWRYLERHRDLFAGRKSSIYRSQPEFCLFGVGPYSFAPYKVVVSGLHKEVRFTLIPPFRGKPVMVDDTCYFVGSCDAEEAHLLLSLFQSDAALRYIRATIFTDNKRPVTADVLNRLDIKKIAECYGKEHELQTFLNSGTIESSGQGLLVFEKRGH